MLLALVPSLSPSSPYIFKLCETISAVERSQGGAEISPRTFDTSLMATKTMMNSFAFLVQHLKVTSFQCIINFT